MAEFIDVKKCDEYDVWTDSGWKSFTGIGKTIEYNEYEIILEDNTSITCADIHIFVINGINVYCKDLKIGDFLQTENGLKKISNIINKNQKSNMFDLLNVDGSVYFTNGILSHNSTTVGAYALWYATFNDDKFIGIVSNKASSAKEILHRIKEMYKSLPIWLKPGVIEWNKNSIEFENGTRIQCAATSASSMRGKSINLLICLTGDNEVNVRNKETGEIEIISMEKLTDRLK